jgi:hypothetical protein
MAHDIMNKRRFTSTLRREAAPFNQTLHPTPALRASVG